jgi:hypothetical protein
MSNGCPNNQLPLENCSPTGTVFTVIPSFGGDGYACSAQGGPVFGAAAGNPYAGGGATLAGYSTLGNYLGQGTCCNPMIQPLCGKSPPPPGGNQQRPAPRPAPRPMQRM